MNDDLIKELGLKSYEERKEEQRKMIESLPLEIRSLGTYLNRFEKTKRDQKIYPRFCDFVLENYPGYAYVFIDRDARPLHLTMEIFKKEKNLNIENRIIAFTRDMLPKKIREITDKLIYFSEDASKTFVDIKAEITNFVKKYKYNKTNLHKYFLQELNCLEKMLFIDTGYWGRCVGYLNNFLKKKQTGYVLVIGPSSSNSYIKYNGSEGGESANTLENQIRHGFEIIKLKNFKGKICADKMSYWRHEKNIHTADYLAVEINALEFLGKLTEEKELEVMKRYAERIK